MAGPNFCGRITGWLFNKHFYTAGATLRATKERSYDLEQPRGYQAARATKEENIHQRCVAAALGYKDASPISRIENGQVPLTLDMVEAFAKVLGATEAEVLGTGIQRLDQSGQQYVGVACTANGSLTITVAPEVVAQVMKKGLGGEDNGSG